MQDNCIHKFLKETFDYINSSIKNKLLLSYVVVIILPLSLVVITTYYSSVNTVEQQSERYNYKMMQLMSEKIDNFVRQIEQASFFVYLDEVQGLLNNPPDNVLDNVQWQNKLNLLFHNWSGFLGINSNIRGVNLIKNGREYFHGGNGAVDLAYNFSELSWYNNALNSNGQKVLISTHNQPYLAFPMNNTNDYCFSLARKVNNCAGNQDIGVLLIDIGLDDIRDILSQTIESNNTYMLITDQDENVIYDINKEIIGKKAYSYYDGMKDINDSGKEIRTINGQKMMITCHISSYTNWRFITAVPTDSLKVNATRLKNIIIVIGFLGFIIAFIISLFFSNEIIIPLRNLQYSMLKVENQNFNNQLPVTRYDEIGQLTNSFNRMVRTIKELINKVYKVEIKEKEAHLNALQSQINPHFLYNTLDTINAMANVQGVEEISKMTVALADLFRYAIRDNGKLVTISDEIRHLNDYLIIQKIRYEDRLNVKIEIPNEICNYKIIKLVIQPLVENAICHGIEVKENGGNIVIRAIKDGENINIFIIDNGSGIESSRLELIKKQLLLSINENNYDSNSERSIGIINVNDRIKLYFGEKYGLTFESILGTGTTVKVTIPSIK